MGIFIAFFILLAALILFKWIGHKSVEESVKRRCTQKTIEKSIAYPEGKPGEQVEIYYNPNVWG